MRFLVRFCKAAAMTGVDATPEMIRLGQARCIEDGSSEKIRFVERDACDTGLPDAAADFVWGEDAWCYVEDKAKLMAEAARIIKPGGRIAFTDWVEGAVPLTTGEAARLLTFMKFPNILTIPDYTGLLEKNGCQVLTAEDTRQFPAHIDLYLNMLNTQLTYDALKIIGFDMVLMQAMGTEMVFMQKLAHEGKLAQGLFIAIKK